uniref:High-affinity choline transporter 1-like n=1 Tax=Erpetoichthys calabaricus TaxID=27687 RepID=A0A8C4RRT7_ERPCA
MALNIPGLIAVIVFYLIILVTGIWASKKSKKEERKCIGARSEVSMVGGRNIGILVGVFTMTATNVGGGFILGTAEATYAHGLLWALGPLIYILGAFIGGIFFAKPMREKKYTTMIDPFQIKYGDIISCILVVSSVLSDIFWTGAILAGLGGMMKVILGIESYQSIIISAAIAICYTLLGGLYSVAYTDIIQLIFIIISLWICIPFLILSPAVTDIVYTATHALHQPPWIGFLDLTNVWNWLDTSFAMVCFQTFYQRVLASASSKVAQITCFLSGGFCFFLGIPSLLIGAMAASTNWNMTSYGLPTPLDRGEPGNIMPIMLEHLCPTYVSIIGIGAVSAAVMSSVDSALLSSSSIFTCNIYKKILRKKASDIEVMWVIRITILIFGVTGMGLGMAASSIYGLWLLSVEISFAVNFAPLVCVLFVPSSNSYGVIVGILVEVVLTLGAGLSALHIPPFIKYPGCKVVNGVYVQVFPYKTLSMVLSLGIIVAVSHLSSFLFNRGLLPETWDIYNIKRKPEVTVRNTTSEEVAEEMVLNDTNPTTWS